GEPSQNGWSVGGHVGWEHDTRDYFFDPWRAIGLSVDAGYTLTALERGDRLSQVWTALELLRLFQLAPGHVLAVDGYGVATFGDIKLFDQLANAGGPTRLR